MNCLMWVWDHVSSFVHGSVPCVGGVAVCGGACGDSVQEVFWLEFCRMILIMRVVVELNGFGLCSY